MLCNRRKPCIPIGIMAIILLAVTWYQTSSVHFTPNKLLGYSHCSVHRQKDHTAEFGECKLSPPLPTAGGLVVATLVNQAWIGMAQNWVCSARKVGLGDHLYLFALEPNVCSHFPGVPCYENPVHIAHQRHGSPMFWEIIYQKMTLALQTLYCTNGTVLFTDTDVAFLKNPIEMLEKELGCKDIVFMAETTGSWALDMIVDKLLSNINAGFMYMRSSTATKALMYSVLEYQKTYISEQAGLNLCTRHPSLHNLKWNTLSKRHFPNGKEFFEYYPNNPDALVVHANFRPDPIGKITSLIASGPSNWCLEEEAPRLCQEYWMEGCVQPTIRPPFSWCLKFRTVCQQHYGVEL